MSEGELKACPRSVFRTKLREIEAVQFHGVGHYEARGLQYPEGVCFCEDAPHTSASPHAHVHTAHGQAVLLAAGDWISPEPDGRGFYPIKPDIFDARYEPATPTAPIGKEPTEEESERDARAMTEGLPIVEKLIEAGDTLLGLASNGRPGRIAAQVGAWEATKAKSRDTIAVLEEALEAIIARGPERDVKWAGMTARDIAIHALTKVRSA